MVNNYAIVADGKVVNVALADQALGPEWIQSDTAAIGDLWDGTSFTRPEPPPYIPPEGEFKVLRWTIPADASEQAVVTYTASETVHFVVDDTLHAVGPIDGMATLEIFANAPGAIRIEVRDKSAVITAVEV